MKPPIGFRILNHLLSAAFVGMMLMAVFTIGPFVETRWWPVYSSFKIVSMERLNEKQTSVIFKFTKYRQCEPQGSGWFFGEPGAAFRQLHVVIQNQNPTGSRPIGTQITNPFIIDATIEELANATFAEIYNRCHPFWLTRSEIYP